MSALNCMLRKSIIMCWCEGPRVRVHVREERKGLQTRENKPNRLHKYLLFVCYTYNSQIIIAS